MKNHIIALLLTLLTAAVLKAENTMETSVHHITMADGLPANSVRCIFQDSMGFIWLGTINNGLCRSDGGNLKGRGEADQCDRAAQNGFAH